MVMPVFGLFSIHALSVLVIAFPLTVFKGLVTFHILGFFQCFV